MSFQVPASKKSIKQNRFEFTIDGVEHSIPLADFMSVAAAEALEEGRNVAGLMLCCDSEATQRAVRGLTGDQVEALIDEWQKESSVEVGESDGSASS